MNKLLEVSKILLKWSIKEEEWFITVLLFQHLNIGIPNKFIYGMPQKRSYNSLNSALSNKDDTTLSHNNSKLLKSLLVLFKSSKWCKLKEWDGLYGYRYNF
jgi:hypothetical protein